MKHLYRLHDAPGDISGGLIHCSRMYRVGGGFLRLLLLTAVCVLSCDTSRPLMPYRLLVAGSRGTESDIYLMNGTGDIVRRLTDTPNRAEMWPVSRAGWDTVYFEARTIPDKDIMICRLDLRSGEEDTLYGPAPPGELWFNLSPDGRKMAYVTPESTHTSLRIRDVITGSERIVFKAHTRFIRPTWAPDSRRLVCQMRRNEERQWDLVVVDAGDGALRKLTDTPDVTEFKARWSPDGSHIVTSLFEGADRSKVRIIVLSVEEGARSREFGGPRDRIISAVWAPDGTLAAVRERPHPLELLIWPGGSPVTALISGSLPGTWRRGRAVWSPDSRYLALNISGSRQRGTRPWRIVIMNSAGHIVDWWPDEMSMYCPEWTQR